MVIKFDKKIYKLKAVKLAIRDYKELADFVLKTKGDYFEVELKNIDPDVKNIIQDEFCNYVLGIR